MQGIDKSALELMACTGRKISEQALASFRFESATDLAAAVSGADAVVESYSTIDRTGVRPEMLAPLPPGPAAVCATHLAEQELTSGAWRRRRSTRCCRPPRLACRSFTAPRLDRRFGTLPAARTSRPLARRRRPVPGLCGVLGRRTTVNHPREMARV
jgi:hypothetical protein